MSWSGLTLVTDNELASYEPATGNGQWKATTWPNQRAQAKLELQSWIETDYREQLGDAVCDKIRDTFAADKVWGYVSSAFDDVTDEATNDDENDVDLSDVFVTPASDRLYIGYLGSFDGLDVTMLSAVNAVASVLTVKYWGAAGWTSLTATDGTSISGKTFAQSGRITWTQPNDWQRRTLDNSADAYFWIELSVSAALTNGTSLGQLLMIRPPIALKRIALLLALGYIVQNLASQAPSTDYWIYKARNQFKTGYLDMADARYAELRMKGGIPFDVDGDGIIEPEEQAITQPLRLGRA